MLRSAKEAAKKQEKSSEVDDVVRKQIVGEMEARTTQLYSIIAVLIIIIIIIVARHYYMGFIVC